MELLLDFADIVYQRAIYPRIISGTENDRELAHEKALEVLEPIQQNTLLRRTLDRMYRLPDSTKTRLQRYVAGIYFTQPLGIAAGFDKNVLAPDALGSLGFNVEVGSLTRIPYGGNPRPRIFSLSENQALINRMGFPGEGLDAGIARLKQIPHRMQRDYVIGGNVGASRPSFERGTQIEDYVAALAALAETNVDYRVINVSSPNTEGVRGLQDPAVLRELLAEAQKTKRPKMLFGQADFLKIAPDLTGEQLYQIVQIAMDFEMDGIIATNTSTHPDRRLGLKGKHAREVGGVSGKPLTERSLEITRFIYEQAQGKLAVIRAGGVMSAEDYWNALTYGGADAVQILTAFVDPATSRPSLAYRWNSGVANRMRELGVRNIDQIKGVEDLPYQDRAA